ncbi:hypothetical protein FRB99_007062 [Tulasnella sp. 403]|nr:hypothetical protein FRB99_007062 [Tulasnella sp. 403]
MASGSTKRAAPSAKASKDSLAPAAAVNGKKRSASRSPSPARSGDSPLTAADSDSQNASQSTQNSEGSERKRARRGPSKRDREPALPTRTSKRRSTKANSKASQAKAAGALGPKLTAKASTGPKQPRLTKVLPPPLNPLPGIPAPLRPARQLFVFGTGDMGQFGLGTDVLGEIKRPRLHAWFDEAVKDGKLGSEAGAGIEHVAVGGMHNLVVDEAGRVWSWGISSDGVLGFDGKPNSPKFQFFPISIPVLKQYRFVEAACGSDHVIALSTQGYVFAWGDSRQGAIGRKVLERHILNGLDPDRLSLRNIVHVASGSWHSFAVDSDGVVYGWGLNSMGQVGLQDESYFDLESDDSERQLEDHITSPTILRELHPDKLGNGRRVVQISGGEHHTIFRLSDGSVYGCGRHDSAQLGLGKDHPASIALKKLKERHPSTLECVPYPVPIYFPSAPTPDNNDPSLGPHAEVSAPGPDGGPQTPIIHISAGTRHNLAVSRDGIVYGWGYGSQYQLGMGELDQQDVPARVKSKAMEGWVIDGVHAGGQHCLLTARKRVEEAPAESTPATS